jgi:hypothetical protein
MQGIVQVMLLHTSEGEALTNEHSPLQNGEFPVHANAAWPLT